MSTHPDARRQPAHASAVRDEYRTLAELSQAAEDVRGLLAHPGWTHVARLLEHEVTDLDRGLDGQLLEHTEYAYRHGRRRGLRAAPDLAHAVVSIADQRAEEQRIKHERGAESPPRGAA